METTWLDAPAARRAREVEYNGTTYTVVGTSQSIDHVWWKKNGVLYWVSNTLSYYLSTNELIKVAESMIVIPSGASATEAEDPIPCTRRRIGRTERWKRIVLWVSSASSCCSWPRPVAPTSGSEPGGGGQRAGDPRRSRPPLTESPQPPLPSLTSEPAESPESPIGHEHPRAWVRPPAERGGREYGRSDTIILVHIDPDNDYLSLLSLPVTCGSRCPGYGMKKINAAYRLGWAGSDHQDGRAGHRRRHQPLHGGGLQRLQGHHRRPGWGLRGRRPALLQRQSVDYELIKLCSGLSAARTAPTPSTTCASATISTWTSGAWSDSSAS